MISLGLRPDPETRSAGGYTDALVDRLTARAGDPLASSSGAIVTASLMWSRCLSICENDHRAVTGSWLAGVGLDLGMAGEHLSVLTVDELGVRLVRASHWSVLGGPDPTTWRYLATLPGPSSTVVRNVPAAAVVHVLHAPPADTPWRSEGPWRRAPELAALAAGVEAALRAETSHPVDCADSDAAGNGEGCQLGLPRPDTERNVPIGVSADYSWRVRLGC